MLEIVQQLAADQAFLEQVAVARHQEPQPRLLQKPAAPASRHDRDIAGAAHRARARSRRLGAAITSARRSRAPLAEQRSELAGRNAPAPPARGTGSTASRSGSTPRAAAARRCAACDAENARCETAGKPEQRAARAVIAGGTLVAAASSMTLVLRTRRSIAAPETVFCS